VPLNEQRATAGLPALVENSRLDQAATACSQLMVACPSSSHEPQGQTVVDRLRGVGYLPGNGQWSARNRLAQGRWPRRARS
jgi:uncharacterized protein YkwD